MPLRRTCLTALAFLAATPTLAPAQEVPPVPPLAERLHVASKLYARVPVYFAHWDGLPAGFDLDSVYRVYLDSAVAARTRLDFARASMRFVASLNNGHSRFRDATADDAHGASMGFAVDCIEGRFVITQSWRDDLRPGDVITALDGEPMEQAYQRLRPYVHGSHDAWRRHSLFWRRVLFPPAFTLTLHDGREVRVVREDRPRAADAPPPEPQVHSRWLEPGRVGYLRVRSFNDATFRDSAVAMARRFHGAPALIVDVRDNGGGTTPVALMQYLQDRPWRWWAEATPAGPALDRSRRPRSMLRWAAETEPAGDDPYTGRLLIITDGGCFSACEDFVVPFKDNGRATIVGTMTGGSSGQPHFEDLGDGMHLMLGMKREYLPDGREFEGVGIAPDVPAEATVASVRAGTDPVLERALALAGEAPRAAAAGGSAGD